jgi:hypothetical protein
MTIDSSWIACFKEEAPEAFTKHAPFEPTAVFCDGQIRLMCPMSSEALTWDDYIERQFGRHVRKNLERRRVACVILAFDDYARVPEAKSMTQQKRRRHLPAVTIHARDALPPVVPQGAEWQQCISNRTFKSKVIELVIYKLTSTLQLGEGQSLIVDYQGHPVRYSGAGAHCGVPLTDLAPLGEADVKFVRYAALYEKLQVDSVDGDSVPIALLHMEAGGGRVGNISILRLETRIKGEEPAADKKRARPDAKPGRVYEFVNVGLLYAVLRSQVIPQCLGRTPLLLHDGHEIAMLVALIGLSGTDFTRGLPLVSGKTMYELLPDLWLRLARAYDPRTRQLEPRAAADLVVATVYQRKFQKHAGGPGAALADVLGSLRGSSLSERTKGLLPTAETLHCTVRNTNWLLRYWTEQDYPDPVQPQFGFVRGGGAVRFEA